MAKHNLNKLLERNDLLPAHRKMAEEAKELADEIMRQYKTEYKGLRTHAREEMESMIFEDLIEGVDADTAYEGAAEWITESWANRY